MAEKKIQARIRQKVDTKANWDKATNFVPLKGEYIYYSDLHRVKVGDGVTKVGTLPFLADSDTHQSIKTLNTNNTTAQTASANETIAGSGTINLHKVAKTGSYNDLNNKPSLATVATSGSYNDLTHKPTIPTVPTNYVTTNTKQTITGEKTFNAPATASGEQATAIFKTANGGQIILGKEGPNSGSMIGLDQVAGTRRLNFRASATPGAIVWSQPESGSSLIYDVDRVDFRQPGTVTFSSATTVTLPKMPSYSVLATDSSGKIIKGSPVQGPKGDKGDVGPAGSVASFKAGSGSGNVITGLTLNSDKSVTYDKAIHALDMGTSATVVNQVVYNPVEMKKALTVPSIQTTPIQYGPGATEFESAVSIGSTTVNGHTAAQIRLVSPGLGSATITVNSGAFSIANGTTLACQGGIGSPWTIDDSPIITAKNMTNYLSVQQWKLTSTTGTVTTVNICTK